MNLEAIHVLAERDVTVNATACLSLGQAVLAATAGAVYVSILAGRVADEGGDPHELLDRLADHRYSRGSVAQFLGVEPR